jgi:hypothetical protein
MKNTIKLEPPTEAERARFAEEFERAWWQRRDMALAKYEMSRGKRPAERRDEEPQQ